MELFYITTYNFNKKNLFDYCYHFEVFKFKFLKFLWIYHSKSVRIGPSHVFNTGTNISAINMFWNAWQCTSSYLFRQVYNVSQWYALNGTSKEVLSALVLSQGYHNPDVFVTSDKNVARCHPKVAWHTIANKFIIF